MSATGRRQLKSTTLRKQVADALREAILSGELRPGEKLREVDLAQRFGVSRNPVREAMGELEQQGLITSLPNQGKVVVSPTDEELIQAYQVRLCLEMLALHLAWEHITQEHLVRWRHLVDLMRQASADAALGPVERHGRLNVLDAEFHGLLIQATHNKTLMRAWHSASPWALGFIRDLERERAGQAHALSESDPHEQFVAALERRDMGAAREALLTHVSRSWTSRANGEPAIQAIEEMLRSTPEHITNADKDR